MTVEEPGAERSQNRWSSPTPAICLRGSITSSVCTCSTRTGRARAALTPPTRWPVPERCRDRDHLVAPPPLMSEVATPKSLYLLRSQSLPRGPRGPVRGTVTVRQSCATLPLIQIRASYIAIPRPLDSGDGVGCSNIVLSELVEQAPGTRQMTAMRLARGNRRGNCVGGLSRDGDIQRRFISHH